MGCCKHGNTDGECLRCEEDFAEEVEAANSVGAKRIAALEAENAELRAALYDEQHGISFHLRDAELQRLHAVEAAARNLCNQGRHNTKIAMLRLMSVCGY